MTTTILSTNRCPVGRIRNNDVDDNKHDDRDDSWNFGDFIDFEIPQFSDDMASIVETKILDDEEIRSIFSACDKNEKQMNAKKREKEQKRRNDDESSNNSKDHEDLNEPNNLKNDNNDSSHRKSLPKIKKRNDGYNNDHNDNSYHRRSTRKSNKNSTSKSDRLDKKNNNSMRYDDEKSLSSRRRSKEKVSRGCLHPCLTGYSVRDDSLRGEDGIFDDSRSRSTSSSRCSSPTNSSERKGRSRSTSSSRCKSPSNSNRSSRSISGRSSRTISSRCNTSVSSRRSRSTSREERLTSNSRKQSRNSRRPCSKDKVTSISSSVTSTANANDTTNTGRDFCATNNNDNITKDTKLPKFSLPSKAKRSISADGTYNDKWTPTRTKRNTVVPLSYTQNLRKHSSSSSIRRGRMSEMSFHEIDFNSSSSTVDTNKRDDNSFRRTKSLSPDIPLSSFSIRSAHLRDQIKTLVIEKDAYKKEQQNSHDNNRIAIPPTSLEKKTRKHRFHDKKSSRRSKNSTGKNGNVNETLTTPQNDDICTITDAEEGNNTDQDSILNPTDHTSIHQLGNNNIEGRQYISPGISNRTIMSDDDNLKPRLWDKLVTDDIMMKIDQPTKTKKNHKKKKTSRNKDNRKTKEKSKSRHKKKSNNNEIVMNEEDLARCLGYNITVDQDSGYSTDSTNVSICTKKRAEIRNRRKLWNSRYLLGRCSTGNIAESSDREEIKKDEDRRTKGYSSDSMGRTTNATGRNSLERHLLSCNRSDSFDSDNDDNLSFLDEILKDVKIKYPCNDETSR